MTPAVKKLVKWLSVALALVAPPASLGLRYRDGRHAREAMARGLAVLDTPLERAPSPEALNARAAEGDFALTRSLDPGGDLGRRADALWHVARAYGDLARGEAVLAATETQTAQRVAPDEPRVVLAVAVVALRGGDAPRAERLFDGLDRAEATPSAVRARSGVCHVDVLLDEGRAHEALTLAETLARDFQNAAPVSNRLGLARMAVGDRDGAETAFRRAAALDPRDPAPVVNEARLARTRGDLTGARDALQRALGLAPEDGATWLAYGVVLADLHAPGARAAIIRAAQLAPEDAGPYAAQGAMDLAAGDWTNAVESFREALTRAPDDAAARTNLGVALARLGDRTGAMAAFEEATRRAPTLGAAWNGLGAMRLAAGDAEGAVGPLQQATVLLPTDPNPPLNLGLALERLQRWDDAARAYHETLVRAPDNETALRHLLTLQPGPPRPGRRRVAQR